MRIPRKIVVTDERFEQGPEEVLRLTPAQRRELDDALSCDLTPEIIRGIGRALAMYRLRRDHPRPTPQTIRASLLRRANAAAVFLSALPPDEREHGTLGRAVRKRLAEWQQRADVYPHVRRRGRPRDLVMRGLSIDVIAVLEGAGVPLTLGRHTSLVETLRVVLRWADALDDKPPRVRRNTYEVARDGLRWYRVWKEAQASQREPVSKRVR